MSRLTSICLCSLLAAACAEDEPLMPANDSGVARVMDASAVDTGQPPPDLGFADVQASQDGAAPDDGIAPSDTGLVADGGDAGVDAGNPPGPDSGFDVGPGDAGFPDRGMPPVDSCITDPTPGAHTFSCMGLSFEVAVPAQCPPAGCGMIVDVHGLSMSGPMAEANTRLAARASALDFVVIQPSATPSPPLASWTPNIDDPKVDDFMNRAQAVFQTDPKRLHMTGFSQGGYMTWRFMCANTARFASVAPGAASDYCSQIAACNFTSDLPSEEIPVLYLHGMNDPLVPFSCGEQQIDAMITAWSLGTAAILSQDANYEHRRYTSPGGNVVEYLRHSYQSSATSLIPFVPDLVGHCYPGSTDPGNATGQLYSFACDPPNAFDWGQEVLDFFIAHPRP